MKRTLRKNEFEAEY